MAVNEFPQSHPPEPLDNVTGWHQRLASEGKHASYSQFRAAQRRSQAPAGPLPPPHPEGPQIIQRGPAFVEGATSGLGAIGYPRPSMATRLAFGAAGAVLASELYRRARRSR